MEKVLASMDKEWIIPYRLRKDLVMQVWDMLVEMEKLENDPRQLKQ
jgi:hypothetical protein